MDSAEPLEISMFADYNRYWNQCQEFSSDQSFIITWAWSERFGYKARWTEDLIWVTQERPEPCWLPPVGNWQRDDWNAVLNREIGPKAHFVDVPTALVKIWQDQLGSHITAVPVRDSFEYLYSVEELATLKGNKHMRRRNRINQFRRRYAARYLSLTPEMTPRIIELQNTWIAQQQAQPGSMLEDEHQGILKVLGHWQELKMTGGAIELDGKLIAYELAEPVNNDLIMIHYEKALAEYPQAYQVINCDFLACDATGFKVVNREEDMGDPGLRQAKMAYCPSGFVEKYTVDWNADR